MRERHGRRAKVRRIGDREVDLVLRRHGPLERDPVRLRHLVAMAMLDEVQTLLLGERAAQILGAPDQARLSLLADATLEYRLDEYRAVPIDQRLDLLFTGIRPEDFRARKAGELEKLRAVQHARDLHAALLSLGARLDANVSGIAIRVNGAEPCELTRGPSCATR